ncbi:lipase chaperone [Acinetobacter sp. WCHAc010034]|uniref:lipase secretion chaperone n=1 Tax=Acinetobacter sp. WCHAc010034 TaxID=1879049 RepID=UPI00083B7722|nr:lipase secretion chaperone [Acinetobacter sp. WCHAc010034]AYA02988.1 lipase chaperone [Acinetobacter sp. WCHAc010034]
MPKYKLWISAAAAVLIIGALVFWLMPQDGQASAAQNAGQPAAAGNNHAMQARNPDGAPYFSPSQQDTEINCQIRLDGAQRLIVNEQTRNCFEYFITQYGEKSIDQIKQDFGAYIRQSYKEPALTQILALWSRYIDYRERLGGLQAPDLSQDDPQYYRAIYAGMQNLRKQFFSGYEIEGLFGAENTYHEYTLKRMEVMNDKTLNEGEKAGQLKALFDELPQDWKENLEQLNKLEDLRKLTADIKARGGSAEEIRQMRTSLAGPEAAQRLEALDMQRADWKNKVNGYLAERDSIMQSGMSDDAKRKAVQQLRGQHFQTREEQLRASTFESVHDQGGKLPYGE